MIISFFVFNQAIFSWVLFWILSLNILIHDLKDRLKSTGIKFGNNTIWRDLKSAETLRRTERYWLVKKMVWKYKIQASKSKHTNFNLDRGNIFIKTEWKQSGNCRKEPWWEVKISSLPLDLFEHSVKAFQEDHSTPAECTQLVPLAWQEV